MSNDFKESPKKEEQQVTDFFNFNDDDKTDQRGKTETAKPSTFNNIANSLAFNNQSGLTVAQSI